MQYASVAFASLALVACHDTDLSGVASAGDASADGSGTGITVTTLAPALTSAPSEKANATWAAYQLDDGAWRVLEATAVGRYEFSVPTARWAIALVCASADDALTTVFIHRRAAAIHDLEVSLEEQCTPAPPPAEYGLSGTIDHLPATTQWLDFGYARDTRGSVLPVAGGKAAYEIVGIAPGTWDLGFGLRDDSFSALTRIVLLRGTVVTADRTLDIDATGPTSFVPVSKSLILRNLGASDSVEPKVLYAAGGGPHGIDVGPQDVPADKAEVTLAYSTVPEGMQLAADRYRGIITAERDRRTTVRSIDFTIHQAIDLDVMLLPVLPKPSVVLIATTPQVRLDTRFPVFLGAVRHEVRVLAEINRRTQHVWNSTIDGSTVPGGAAIVDTMPDLSGLPGWRASWGLPLGVTATVTATSVEKEAQLGDGTMQRKTGNSTEITP